MKIIARYIHGSQDSIDCDVLYVVDRLPSQQECVVFCLGDASENRNIAVVCDGVISECFKGFPDELNNSILATYPLHTQKDKLLITRAVERDKVLKYLSVLRKLIMELRHTTLRDQARRVLKNPGCSYTDRVELLEETDLGKLEWTVYQEDQIDRIKSMAFQLGQAIALSRNIEVYTKQSIYEVVPSLRPYLERRTCSADALNDAKKVFIEILRSLDLTDCGGQTVCVKGEDGPKCISLKGKEHYI